MKIGTLKGARLGTLREDLHEQYGDRLKAHIIDGVLDVAVAERQDSKLHMFSLVFIERDARQQLDAMVAQAAPGVNSRVAFSTAA